jgi:TetR/AcrR family transcriptional regulator, cholesterol catabolism regulator
MIMIIQERILAQAADLFVNSGIKAITMDDISREAGVSKRTIYENFKDKDELLRSCLMYMDSIHEKETGGLIAEAKNTVDLVFSFLKHGVSALNRVNPLFFADLKRYHYRVWKETYLINYEKNLSRSCTLLKKGINEGLFRKDIDIEIVAKLLHEQIRIMSDEQVFPSDKYSKTIVFEHILINFLRGIATPKGLTVIEEYNVT